MMTDKESLRKSIRGELKKMSDSRREQGSQDICSTISQLSEFQSARSVLFFLSRWDEPSLNILISNAFESEKMVHIPRFNEQTKVYEIVELDSPDLNNLRAGRYDILEPDPSKPSKSVKILDFCLVPGLMFGRDGGRIGRGKGYFDRLLDGFTGCRTGVCFEEQVRASVPLEPHDILMDIVCTDKAVYKRSKANSIVK